MAEAVRAPSEPDLEEWIGAFRGPLVGLCTSWGASWQAAEELAQDTFAEAWVGRARFRGDPADAAAAGAWLRGIAWNLFCSWRRREERRRAAPLEVSEPIAPQAEPDERRALLERCFARLSAPHQSVLRMVYLEETRARDVAALLGITQKAVEDRLYQARKALRALVEREAQRSAQEVRP